MKLRVVVLLAMLALLLQGCGAIDKAIDDTIPLKGMAFINFSQEAAQNLLLPLKCLVPFALIGAITGIKKRNWGKVSKMLSLMFGVGLLPYILPAIEQIGRALWPNELTLSWIATQLGWVFPIPVGDKNLLSFVWALALTLNWPSFHAVMQIAASAVLVISVTVAIMTKSWRPLMVGVVSVASWVLAPSVVKNVIEMLGSVRPDNAIVSTLVVFNLIYLIAMLMLGLLVYFVPPILVMIFMPGESSADEGQATQDDLPPSEGGGGGIPLVIPVPFPVGSSGGGDGSESSGSGGDGGGVHPSGSPDDVIYVYPSNNGSLPSGDEPIEGVWRDVTDDGTRGALPQLVIGDEVRDEADELPEMFAAEAKTIPPTTVISDDDDLSTSPAPEADSILDVSSGVAQSSSDDASPDDELPLDSPKDTTREEKAELPSGPDLFAGAGVIVITDEE